MPETINGILWPTGILPKLKDNLADFAIVRSMRAWALVHGLAQTWTQIGRNPAAALGNIAPNIGSIVAIEKTPERLPSHVFPTFIGLNSSGAAGSGYLSASTLRSRRAPTAAACQIPSNPDGQPRLKNAGVCCTPSTTRFASTPPSANPLRIWTTSTAAAKGMMYNQAVKQAFGFVSADSARYGGNSFGNACLVAKQVLAANSGHPLHPDHRRRLGHAPEHLRREWRPHQGLQHLHSRKNPGCRRVRADQRPESLRALRRHHDRHGG